MPLGHLGVNVPDLAAAKSYYDDLMPLLGYEEFFSRPDEFSYRPAGGKPGTFVFFYPAQEPGDYSRHRPGVQHLAFIVETREAVERVHEFVLARDGTVVFPPKEFAEYHPGYFATFWLDPFGHMLEAVCHGEGGARARALSRGTQRQLAVDLFNHVWTLLDKAERTDAESAEMVHAAHASCYHWLQVGTALNEARGEWQCSRVYAVLRRAEPALHHARRCLDICRREGFGDFDLAYAYEALARAHVVGGDPSEARRWLGLARAAAEDVAEADDRELVLADLADISEQLGR